MRRPTTTLVLMLLLLAAPGSWAHDLWIEPSSFAPAPGQRIAVRLRLGQGFRGDPVPRDPSFLERFVAAGPAGEAPVQGVPWGEPAGYAAFTMPGTYLIAYDSSRARLEQDGPKFERYLVEEGLERIHDLRAKQGRTAAPGKEVFSRCAKSLVTVGAAGGKGHDRVLGLPLELVPEASPAGLRPGADLPVRLLYQGKPLAGALVVAIPREDPEAQVAARSDAQGRVLLRLGQGGDWLVKAVHMIPAPKEAGADWESFWASLTFRMPAS